MRHAAEREQVQVDPVIVTGIRSCSVTERVALCDRRSATRTTLQVPVDGFLGKVTYAIDGAVDPAAVSPLAKHGPVITPYDRKRRTNCTDRESCSGVSSFPACASDAPPPTTPGRASRGQP
jgi:hypothetical protein